MHTTASQNAIRKRKNMTLPVVPGSLSAPFELSLADIAETVIGNAQKF
jgi:hypothetical protein